MPDHYTYPGSDVLINKLGITDYEHWKFVETEVIGQRMGELREHPIPGSYDLTHLLAIHRALTRDLYVWAGEIRDTDTHPGGTGIIHCRPEFIDAEAERVFGEFAARDHLRGLDADAFADGLAWAWGETTSLHATRDVNTRSQHIFFNQLARDAGWIIDWSRIPGDVFAHARTLAIVENHSGIDALIRPNRYTVEEAARQDELLERVHDHARGLSVRTITRDPEALDRELDAARERRLALPPDVFRRDTPHGGGPGLGR